MKRAWAILIISALTDFIITAATGLSTAIVAAGAGSLSRNAVLLAVCGGIVTGSRTIQQALKATPETSAALSGNASVVTTSTIEKTP